ncbi:MAG TPA: XrtA system polysaccharide deacetylase [Stellaceae bacterium]|nr:XrtA system polysaccharide deacetylase [Stellaceae bacterium]
MSEAPAVDELRAERSRSDIVDGGSAVELAAGAKPAIITNAMTVDVEDYFQVQALSAVVSRAEWDRLPSRVEGNTDRVLDLFAEHRISATFFTLGWVAERHPRLIRRIVAAGHELASHGCAHWRADEQSPADFRADVRRSKDLLEQAGGVAVKGYRAASFSIGAGNSWAFAVLAEEGYAYSSSVYPVRHDIYGMPEAPRFPYRPIKQRGFREFPITTMRLLGRNWPCGGGGYFRLLPYALSQAAIKTVHRADRRPCIFYFHPWEIDPGQPVRRGLPLKSRFRHYTNLGRMEGKLRRLLRGFAWDRMDRVLDAELPA